MITAKDLPKACFLCGRNGTADPLDAHHIFGGANRKLSEKYALVVPLCHNRCHENGKDAVHRNAAVAQAVHEFGQRLAMERMGWSIEEFRAVFGRNYLPEPSESEDLFEDLFEDPYGGRISFCTPKRNPEKKKRPGHLPKGSPGPLLPAKGGTAAAVPPIGSSFRGTGDEGSAHIGSPCGGRGTEDGGRETRDGRRGTQDAGRETRDEGFRITEEEDLPEWLLI